MTKVTDPNLIKKLQEKSGNVIPNNLKKVTDESLIATLQKKKEQQAPSFFNNL